MKLFLYGLAAGVILGFGICWFLARQPTGAERTRVVYKDRPAPKRLLTPPTVRPATRYLYLVRTDTVRVCLPVPVDIGRLRGVLPEGYITQGRRRINLRYWSPDSLRYVEEVYRFDPPTWGAWIETGAGYAPISGFYADALVAVRRRSTVAFAGYRATTSSGRGVSFGIRRRIAGFY